MSFTSEEIAATGWAWGKDQLPGPLSYAWAHEPISEWDDLVQELALRLALAHPERADLALGEGWHFDGELLLRLPEVEGEYACGYLCVTPGQVSLWVPQYACGTPLGTLPLLPAFDAALARARRIAAAWQRIQAKDGVK